MGGDDTAAGACVTTTVSWDDGVSVVYSGKNAELIVMVLSKKKNPSSSLERIFAERVICAVTAVRAHVPYNRINTALTLKHVHGIVIVKQDCRERFDTQGFANCWVHIRIDRDHGDC